MIEIINAIIQNIGIAIVWAINLLPDSPFNFLPVDNHFFRFLNSVFPVTEVIALLQIWTSAVLIFYGIRILLRWLKVASA